MDLTFTEKQMKIMKGKDISKQKEVIIEKLKSFKGENISSFFWRFLSMITDEEEIEKDDEPKHDDDDEEEEKKNEHQNERKNAVSMLIDFEAATNEKGMCSKGHFSFFDKPKGDKCSNSECQRKQDVLRCFDCYSLSSYKVNNYLCKHCRHENMVKLQNEWKMDGMKSIIIHNELNKKPTLSMDLLCGLPRKTGLDQLMDDIMTLEVDDRCKYMVYLIDLDNLKALNSSLGHEGADGVIKRVGAILKQHTKAVNDGKWKYDGNSIEDEEQSLLKAWCFRQGGDEFAVVVKGECASCDNKRLWSYYSSWKGEINGLKVDKVNKENMDKGKETLKERGRKQLEAAMNTVNANKKMKDSILSIYDSNVDVNNIEFNIDKIGVSVGLFIPFDCMEKEWILCAEKAQDAAKEMEGKNQIRIYYEGKGAVIPSQDTMQCFNIGCYDFYKKN